MTRRPILRAVLHSLAATTLFVAATAAAQDGPVPVPPRPDAVESGGPGLPQVVPYVEPETLRRRAAPSPAPAAPAIPPAQSSSRVIAVDVPPAENTSPRFVFRDATARPTPRTRTLAEREATVDAIRRGLAPQGGSER